MGFRGGGGQIDPPSVSWFSSTPEGIGLRHGLTNLPEAVEAVGKLKLKGTVAVRLVARSVNGIVRENEEPKIYKFLVNSLEIIKIMVWKLSRSWFGSYH